MTASGIYQMIERRGRQAGVTTSVCWTRPWQRASLPTHLPCQTRLGAYMRATRTAGFPGRQTDAPRPPLNSNLSLDSRQVRCRPAGRDGEPRIRCIRCQGESVGAIGGGRWRSTGSKSVTRLTVPCTTVTVFRSVTALQLSVAHGSWLPGYTVSPPFVRFGSGGHGLEAAAVVVPAGAGLVAPAPAG